MPARRMKQSSSYRIRWQTMTNMDLEFTALDTERGRSPRGDSLPWHAIWTRSHCEQLVSDQLNAKGFEIFFPKAMTWVRRGQGRKQKAVPLFPGYLFLRHGLDKASHIEVLNARGVVRVLGQGWEQPTPIPETEIGSIRRIVNSGVTVFPHAHQPVAGDKVRILAGPLAGVEGVFVSGRPDRGLFVVTISLLQRSVAVELDATQVGVAQ
jgi:transcriptional antiterminator NusG